MKATKAQLFAGLFVASLLFGLVVRPLFAGFISSGWICDILGGAACPVTGTSLTCNPIPGAGVCNGWAGMAGNRCARVPGQWALVIASSSTPL